MDPLTRLLMQGAAGAGGEVLGIEDVFSTWLYTGNGSTQTITNGIDLSGEGGLVWLKNRSSATSHRLSDTVRGVNKQLATNSTAAETSFTTFLTGFNADGFNIANDSDVNANGSNYASWTFRKAPGFFDVVTYTGNGSNRTIAHNLGSVPGCMIVKQTSAAGQNWVIYHRGLINPEQKYLLFNTSGEGTLSTVWNNTAPTSTVFTVGTDNAVNQSGQTYVAYLFAHDEQIFGEGGDQSVIKCGSYTGSGASTGSLINLGWEPQWVLIKRTSTPAGSQSDNWSIVDNMRGFLAGASSDNPILYPNTSGAENPEQVATISPTGFFPGGERNYTSINYIYIAIRRGPMKTPTDATTVFAVDADSASATIPTWDSGFPVDMAFAFDTLGGVGGQINSARLIGTKYFLTPSAAAENADGDLVWDSNLGWGKSYSATRILYSWMFRRAYKFFDVVCYTGTGSTQSINHNLGVAPELMIVKCRNTTFDWAVYASSEGATDKSFLNGNDAFSANSSTWNNTAPTSTFFTVGTDNDTNSSSNRYIAYLFVSCPGVSKVGSYTGSGTTKQIDCGFTNGAKFVLIKRADSTGDWYVWDSARGIVAGNDPYFLLNSTAAQVTSTDYVDTYSAGFEISSTAPAAINANGGTFIFLAVA